MQRGYANEYPGSVSILEAGLVRSHLVFGRNRPAAEQADNSRLAITEKHHTISCRAVPRRDILKVLYLYSNAPLCGWGGESH